MLRLRVLFVPAALLAFLVFSQHVQARSNRISGDIFLNVIFNGWSHLDLPIEKTLDLYHKTVVLRGAGLSAECIYKAAGIPWDQFHKGYFLSMSGLQLIRYGIPPDKAIGAMQIAKTKDTSQLKSAVDMLVLALGSTGQQVHSSTLERALKAKKVLLDAGIESNDPFIAEEIRIEAIPSTPLKNLSDLFEQPGKIPIVPESLLNLL